MNRGSEKMKKKILSLLVVGVMALNLTGCAMFESEINDIKGNLVGNGYTIDTFDNYGKRVMTTTGDKINIQGNPVETTSYDSDGSIITGYELSSVITITIDGQEIESCGDTCIFTQKGLEPNVDLLKKTLKVMIMENFQIIHILRILSISIKISLVNQEWL